MPSSLTFTRGSDPVSSSSPYDASCPNPHIINLQEPHDEHHQKSHNKHHRPPNRTHQKSSIMAEVAAIIGVSSLVIENLHIVHVFKEICKKYKNFDSRLEKVENDITHLQSILEHVQRLTEECNLADGTNSIEVLSLSIQRCGEDLEMLVSRLEGAKIRKTKWLRKVIRKTRLSLDDTFFADIEQGLKKHRDIITVDLSLVNA